MDDSSNSWNDDIERIKQYHRSLSAESSSSDKVSDMSILLNRLATFQAWPDDTITSATALTNCGLFYTGHRDEVQCHECGVKLQDWKPSDVPYERHRSASPWCKYLAEKSPPKKSNQGACNYTEDMSSRNTEDRGGGTTSTEHIGSRYGSNHTINSQAQYKNRDTNPSKNIPVVNTPVNQQMVHNNTPAPVLIKSNTDVLNVMTNRDNQNTEWFTRRNIQSQPGNQEQFDFTVESNRLLSFTGHWPSNAPVSANELADAGFYYTGPGDRVQCAWCRGGLYNFVEGDTAIGEHIRHFPQCPFIKRKMTGMVEAPGDVQRPNSQNVQDDITNIDDIPAVKIAKQMDYSVDMIRRAIMKLSVGTSYKDVTSDKLMDALFDLETMEQSIENESIPLEGATAMEHTTQNTTTNRTPEGQSMEGNNPSKISLQSGQGEQELGKLVEENDRLKGKTICKICLDNPVQVLFLPCRHLVCCEECSEAVKQCPICRTVIIGTVKTFLS